MSDEKVTECFFEDTQCLWQGNPNCKACARGRNYLYPQASMVPGIMVGMVLAGFVGMVILLIS